MARNKLRDTKVRTVTKPGVYGDGDGLYLRVSNGGAKSWTFIWSRRGRRREIGLGGYSVVSLAVAREKANEARAILGRGGDPFTAMEERKASAKRTTFGECADDLIASMESGWRNDKHRDQWKMTLQKYAKPLRSIAVADISTDQIVKCLKQIWTEKPETASRTRGRIERVLDHAKVRGLRSGENPARWQGHLKVLLPTRHKLSRGHHAAMPYTDVAAFMQRLRATEGTAGRALEFTVLTAARTGETIGACWDEINFDEAVWTVPAARMKASVEHRVPLSPPALAVVRGLYETRSGDHVFPGRIIRKPLSNMSMTAVMRRMKLGAFTVHGFRSSFRDWCSEETEFQREVAEAALAHVLGDKVEAAYRRGDALEKRRKLMVAWATYCGAENG